MHNILILTDEPIKDYEILCFNTLRYYSEKNEYDLMIRSDYTYDDSYDYLIYISNNCLIMDIDIKIENYINKKYLLQTYEYIYDENINNFLIIKNLIESPILLNNLNDIVNYQININKNINYISFNNIDYNNINYKNPNFLKIINNPFMFICGEYEINNTSLNNVILNYIFNQLFNIFYFKKDYLDINVNINKFNYNTVFETFNPNNKIAFVTKYPPSMKESGIQMEYNIKNYCQKNNYTFYIHRDNDIICKHDIIKEHIKNHEYVIWCDYDILSFDMDFKIENEFKNDISFYIFKDLKKFYNNDDFFIIKNDSIGNKIISECETNNTDIKNIIKNKYIKSSYIGKLSDSTSISLLNKNSNFINFNNFKGFFKLILLEYFNYVTFSIKYKGE